MKYVAGLFSSGLGTMCLAAVLQRVLDPGGQPSDLLRSAGVAALAGLFMFVAGVCVVGLAALVQRGGNRREFVWPFIVMFATPLGVALSFAFSFASGALYAMLVPADKQWVVSTVGVALLYLGYRITSNLWRQVLARLAAAPQPRAAAAAGAVPLDQP